MTPNTPIILACLRINVERARDPRLRKFAEERLAAYEERVRRQAARFDNPMERFAKGLGD